MYPPEPGAASREAIAPQPPVGDGAEPTGGGGIHFCSVLYSHDPIPSDRTETQPDFFHDLSLDRVVEAITAGRQEYNLVPFFHKRLTDPDDIAFRQEVMRDVESTAVGEAIDRFAERMRTMRQRLPTEAKRYYEREKQRWFLSAIEIYVEAVQGLARDVELLDLRSRGLRGFRAYLATYAGSDGFRGLAAEAARLVAALAAIRYCTLIRDGTVVVRAYNGEGDYSAAVEQTFLKFRQDVVSGSGPGSKDRWGMNHVEAEIVDRVALLHPATFGALERFCEDHVTFVDPTIAQFDREIQFYVAYLDHVGRLRQAGLNFCYPSLSEGKDIAASETFDLALADKLLRQNATVVLNDFFLRGAERVLVVTGPNQGGKTTFARTFGQVHYLASLGCPVPGREARLFLYDRLFTHFEREEDIATLRGRLEDDLVRIHDILEHATANSILIINEMFSSTTLEDAVYLGRELLTRVLRLDLLCVCVTFLEELAVLGEQTVSVVAAVDPRDLVRRTFRLERRPADGLAYALAIADKHRVTARWLRERIRA